MKNKSLIAMIALTAAFVTFLAGYIVGTLSNRTITISNKETVPTSSYATSAVYTDGKININSATVSDLIQIPGIGTTIAQNIITYRDANGPFKSINDLLQVKGIGAQRLTTLEQYITVSGG